MHYVKLLFLVRLVVLLRRPSLSLSAENQLTFSSVTVKKLTRVYSNKVNDVIPLDLCMDARSNLLVGLIGLSAERVSVQIC